MTGEASRLGGGSQTTGRAAGLCWRICVFLTARKGETVGKMLPVDEGWVCRWLLLFGHRGKLLLIGLTFLTVWFLLKTSNAVCLVEL